ncbi:MAG: carboxypeptidase-like regulatory domain-containing protein [Planctomycetota bacterium]|nr:carboxypeptidase-like regulatory domain-containing protein [Planctomycetota bacterium]
MRVLRLLRGCTIAIASVGILIPHVALGAGATVSHVAEPRNAAGAIAIYDVALRPGGVLQGQVVDPQGRPAAATRVVLAQEGKPTDATQTDVQGRFTFTGLKGGLYQLATAQGGGMYRLWTPGAAPPAAHTDALVVSGDAVVRGGMGNGGIVSFLANPWVLGAIVAAAIAVPLALDRQNAS